MCAVGTEAALLVHEPHDMNSLCVKGSLVYIQQNCCFQSCDQYHREGTDSAQLRSQQLRWAAQLNSPGFTVQLA